MYRTFFVCILQESPGLQMFCKPAFDVSQSLQAQLWMSTARQSMALTLEANKEYFAPQVFQGSEKFFRLFNATAQILFAMDDQQRGVHLLYIGDWRHAHVQFRVIPGGRLHVIVGEFPADVAAAKE